MSMYWTFLNNEGTVIRKECFYRKIIAIFILRKRRKNVSVNSSLTLLNNTENWAVGEVERDYIKHTTCVRGTRLFTQN